MAIMVIVYKKIYNNMKCKVEIIQLTVVIDEL